MKASSDPGAFQRFQVFHRLEARSSWDHSRRQGVEGVGLRWINNFPSPIILEGSNHVATVEAKQLLYHFPIMSWPTLILLNRCAQVAAAPKKRPKKDESEQVEPQTWLAKATDALGELLANAAKARTSALKLKTVPYASELSKQLLDEAAKLEKAYQELRKAVDTQAEDRVLQKLLSKSEEASAFVAKAQAPMGCWGWHRHMGWQTSDSSVNDPNSHQADSHSRSQLFIPIGNQSHLIGLVWHRADSHLRSQLCNRFMIRVI